MTLLILLLISSFIDTVDSDCKSIREGNFRTDTYIDEKVYKTYITRVGNIQIEKSDDLGVEYKFEVEWLDECTYTLVLLETIRDDNNFNYPQDELLTVKVTEVTSEFYKQTAYSKHWDMEIELTVYIEE